MNKLLTRKISSLDWEFENQDTQYLTHGIHRYSGKFIPQIAAKVIELLTKPNDLILDPYCGSGTTLLECALKGRKSIGMDLNPLAVLISKVKSTPIPQDELIIFKKDFYSKIEPLLKIKSHQIGLFDSNLSQHNFKKIVEDDPKCTEPFYVKWFQNDIRYELIWIYNQICSLPNLALRNIALVAFSDILRKTSNAHSSYPNVMYDKNKSKVVSTVPLFFKRFDEVIAAILEMESILSTNMIPKVIRGNARAMAFKNESFDAVITHPPYIGSVPYAEYGLLSLKWLGYDPKSLDNQLTGGKRQSKDVVDRFKLGFEDMIKESWRVLKKNGKFFMLLGMPTVKGKQIDIAEMALEISLSVGFTPMGMDFRKGTNRRANKMGEEVLLFFEKNN